MQCTTHSETAPRLPGLLACLRCSSPALPCPAAENQKRDYVRWTPEEEQSFFTALRGVAGQKPEKCLKEITQRVGSKDYAQVGGRVGGGAG